MRAMIMSSLIDPVIVLLYWTSCVVIGACIVHFVAKRFKLSRSIAGITDNIFVKIIIWFGSFTSLMGVYSILLYIFRLPAVYFTGFYICLLITSITYFGYILWNRRNERYKFEVGGSKFWVKVSVLSFVVLLLAADYIISTVLGTMFAGGADTYVHLAKILGLLHYGFVINDSILYGVVESRYHVNIIHALYVPVAQLTHMSPAVLWDLSNGFFRLLQWLGIAGLMYFIARSWIGLNKNKSLLVSVGALVLAFGIPQQYMCVAVYPSRVVSLWLMLFVIGLSFMATKFKEGSLLAIVASILLALTQPTYALMAILFLLIYIVIITIVTRFRTSHIDIPLLKTGAVLVAILCTTPLFTSLFPQHLSSAVIAIGSVPTVRIFGVDVVEIFLPTKRLAIGMAIVALIGYISLITWLLRRSRVSIAILVGLLPIFFYLLASDPVFMAIAHDKLPLWLIGRFTAMNILQSVIVFIGLYAIGYVFYTRMPIPTLSKKVVIYGVVISCLIFAVFGAWGIYKDFYRNTLVINNGNYERLERVKDNLSGVMQPGSLAVTTLSDSYFLPSAIPIKTLAIDSTHATPTADSDDRVACLEQLFTQNLDTRDLDLVAAKYVVLPQWYEHLAQLKDVISSSDRFTQLKETSDYIVYSVKTQKPILDATSKTNPCYRYQIEEHGKLY